MNNLTNAPDNDRQDWQEALCNFLLRDTSTPSEPVQEPGNLIEIGGDAAFSEALYPLRQTIKLLGSDIDRCLTTLSRRDTPIVLVTAASPVVLRAFSLGVAETLQNLPFSLEDYTYLGRACLTNCRYIELAAMAQATNGQAVEPGYMQDKASVAKASESLVIIDDSLPCRALNRRSELLESMITNFYAEGVPFIILSDKADITILLDKQLQNTAMTRTLTKIALSELSHTEAMTIVSELRDMFEAERGVDIHEQAMEELTSLNQRMLIQIESSAALNVLPNLKDVAMTRWTADTEELIQKSRAYLLHELSEKLAELEKAESDKTSEKWEPNDGHTIQTLEAEIKRIKNNGLLSEEQEELETHLARLHEMEDYLEKLNNVVTAETLLSKIRDLRVESETFRNQLILVHDLLASLAPQQKEGFAFFAARAERKKVQQVQELAETIVNFEQQGTLFSLEFANILQWNSGIIKSLRKSLDIVKSGRYDKQVLTDLQTALIDVKRILSALQDSEEVQERTVDLFLTEVPVQRGNIESMQQRLLDEEEFLNSRIAILQTLQRDHEYFLGKIAIGPQSIEQTDVIQAAQAAQLLCASDQQAHHHPIEFLETTEGALQDRVVGQEAATAAVRQALQRRLAGLADPNLPIACISLRGPAGSGIRTIAQAVSATLTPETAEPLIFNCAPGAVDNGRLIENTGVRTYSFSELHSALANKALSVVLFENLAEGSTTAREEIANLLRNGSLTIHDKTVSLQNSLVFIAARSNQPQNPWFRELLREHSTPVKLNQHTDESVQSVARLLLDAVRQQTKSRFDCDLLFSDTLLDYLVTPELNAPRTYSLEARIAKEMKPIITGTVLAYGRLHEKKPTMELDLQNGRVVVKNIGDWLKLEDY